MLQPGTLLFPLPLPVAVFDRRLRYLEGNDAWRKMLHAEALLPAEPGVPFFDLFPDSERALAPLIQKALTGETISVAGLRLVFNGSTYFWDITVLPAPGSVDNAGFVCAITDATERMLSRQLLTRRAADRTRKLSALYAILEAAAHSDDLRHVSATALRQGIEATHADAGAILVVGGADDEPRLLAASELTPTLEAALNQPALAETLSQLPQHAVQAAIVVRDRVQGHIVLLRSARRPFGDEDQALLSSMADQLGVVFERALLKLESERVIVIKERNRLARELHDAVTQTLYSLTLFAEASQRMAQSGDYDSAEQTMARVSSSARQALREMRLLVHNLRPSALENAGLEQALRQRIDAVERRAGISAQVEVEGVLRLPAHVEEALYQIAQEALNNSLKHAAAGSVHVRLRQEQHDVLLVVWDDGCGFAPQTVDSGGVGIPSMRERGALLGGELQIGPRQEGGTEVSLRLDLRRVEKPAGSNGLQSLLERSAP